MVEKGLRVISDLHDEPIDSPNVMKMRRNIEQSIELEEREDGQTFNPLWVLWDRSAIKAGKRLRISFLILALQQMMGMFIGEGETRVSLTTRTRRNKLVRVLQHHHPPLGRRIGETVADSCSRHEYGIRHWDVLHHLDHRKVRSA